MTKSNKGILRKRAALSLAVALLFVAGCGSPDQDSAGKAGADLRGTITADGSSTVFPIIEAMAEEFQKENPQVRVTVGISGTGGGFEKFCNGETDLQNASRPIKDEEKVNCEKNKVEYTELEVAFDGLSVMTHPSNDWAECLTVDELKVIWSPGSKVNSWKRVRASFPDKPLKLYGPGTDSGTFDFFTDKIVGEEGASRSDFTASEDDNVLVQGVSGDPAALGYFGFAYYSANKEKLKLLAVDGGDGCVKPSRETILSGGYQPLSRPLLLYVRNDALGRSEVEAFARFTVENAEELVPSVGYVTSPKKVYEEDVKKIDEVTS